MKNGRQIRRKRRMKKIAIVTDSNSGITQSQAKELGVYVLPMPFMINDKTYFEDISLSQDDFYQFLKDDVTISTSQPSPGDVTDLWDELLKEYDEIVHIPMSSGLSSTCATAIMLAQDEPYEGRVFVVNNQRISVTQRQSALDAYAMVQKGYSGAEIQEKLEATRFDSSIYITLDTLYYLKKGGRITPAAAAIGTILRLKPVLQIQGEKLDAYAKARTYKIAKQVMLDAVKKDIENRFGGDPDPSKIEMAIAHTNNAAAADEFAKEVEALYPGMNPHIDPLSLSVACHIGPGALAITVGKKLEY